jgi:voltage-gated potassium channel
MRALKIPRIIRATYRGVVLLAIVALISGILFSLYEEKSFSTSFYWAIVTMTTVGYGDVTALSTAGKVVSIFLACTGILLYGYLGAVIMTVQMESSLSGVFGMKKCKYENHFVICGWTPISEVVMSELLAAGRQVAVITEKQDDVPIIRRMEEKGQVFPIYGDPSKSEVLKQARIKFARVIILSMDDDSKNLITALHIRELNPKARIIVKTSRPELKKTMRIAGVTYVVTPHEMAGRLIASAAFEPEVANFVEDVTTATDIHGYDLQQYSISQEHAGIVSELAKKIKDRTNTTLIAIAKKKVIGRTRETRWEVQPNPPDNARVNPGEIVILLGNDQQFKKVREYLGTAQGR